MNFKKRVNGSWVDTPHYIHNTSTDTITTLPAVIYPTGTTATVGLKGQTTQSSIPSPTSPVMPQGTGERTGNLWDGNYENGVLNTDGTLNAPNANYNTTMYIPTEEKNYTLSVICNYDSGLRLLRVCFYDENKNFISYVDSPGFQGEDFFYKFNFTAPVNSKYLRFSYIFRVGMSDTNIMLNTGSTALPYEPYGYKIPILSANTTTPVYLGEVQTTRKVKKLVLTGKESWDTYQSTYYITVSNYYRMYDIGSHLSVCSHYPGIQVTTLPEMHYCLGGLVDGSTHTAWNGNIVFNPSPMISSLTDWKSYLAQQYANGTPVTVWYVLATPTTGIVNEPLRKIGVYADTVSGITIPTIAGANSFDVLTTLKPSEVTVNYKGWHPVADVHEKSKNLFDKSVTPYSTTGFIIREGALTEYAGWSVSNYVELSSNSEYTLSGMNTNAIYSAICFYTNDKTYISGLRYDRATELTFTTPANCKYALISYITSKIDTVMLNTGSTALPYEPYWK